MKTNKLEYLEELNIIDLVNEWFYEKELNGVVEKMYFNGSVELGFYRDSLEKNKAIENYLFRKLELKYGVKNPYQNIPIDLDYVLNLVK